MAHVVAQTTPCCFCEVYDIMVPDYSSCANSKSEANQKSADFLTEARQFLDGCGWLSRIRHLLLNASQKHRLTAIARLYGRLWQHCLCFNTNARRLSHPAGAAFPHRSISANRRNIVILTQVNVGLPRRLKSLTPLCSSGAYEIARMRVFSHAAESPPDTTPVNTLITVHLS